MPGTSSISLAESGIIFRITRGRLSVLKGSEGLPVFLRIFATARIVPLEPIKVFTRGQRRSSIVDFTTFRACSRSFFAAAIFELAIASDCSVSKKD